MYGDYLLAHTAQAVDVSPVDFGVLPAKDWAVDGARGGTGHSRSVTPLGFGKHNDPGPGIEAHLQAIADKHRAMSATEARAESGLLDGAEHVVVAFGTPAKFVRYAVRQLREQGVPVGYVRPVTLWPFPSDAVAEAAAGARSVLVFEINAGQMIDDVRLAVAGRSPVVGIGGISTDRSGFGVGSLLDVDVIRGRIEAHVQEEASV